MALLYCCKAKDCVVNCARGPSEKGATSPATSPSCRLLTASTACRTAGSVWEICKTVILQNAVSKSPDMDLAVTF